MANRYKSVVDKVLHLIKATIAEEKEVDTRLETTEIENEKD